MSLRLNINNFFYVPYPIKTLVIMALNNILSFLALRNFCFFLIVLPTPWLCIYIVLNSLNILSSWCVVVMSTVSYWLLVFLTFFLFPFPLKLPHCSRVLSMLFLESFYRTIFRLSPFSSSPLLKLSSIYSLNINLKYLYFYFCFCYLFFLPKIKKKSQYLCLFM